ncbi:hypothetical protein BX661DRAFT_183080 [Kickxella alabastrina]|uniref:uncharacterized protein n=1 Tax=Kickxella alabastrina TaxID=61397 RepID=UPI00221E9E44|nr:uncharacterized protein BX661DRAFT_183080 [Kickxella alabastrina]KAI7827334.1 hypothetical protein BX661DRAFT_183080 [Kickxella alabastrina]
MEDIGLALADFVSNMENVPSEISHLLSEITDLDDKFEEATSRAYQTERTLQKELKDSATKESSGAGTGLFIPLERETHLLDEIDKNQDIAKSLCQEKSRLTKKALTIVQRHLAKLDTEIRHFDKTPFDQGGVGGGGGRRGNIYGSVTPMGGTVGIQDGELSSFRMHAPKRVGDSVSSLGLDGNGSGGMVSAGAGGVGSGAGPVPKRRHHQSSNNGGSSSGLSTGGAASAGTGTGTGSSRPVQRHKKQMKLANSVLSLDGIEVDSGGAAGAGGIEESDDQLYCFCQQVSYGDMVACDGPNCRYEWFHWECVGLTSPPKGSWYCSDCLAKLLEEDAE